MSTPPRIETEADRVSAPEAPADAPRTNRWYLSSAPIVSALLHLCVPMAAAMIVGAIYNLINAGFIGLLDNTALLAAVTLGSPILGLVMGVGNVFGVGGGALVSRLLGGAERDPSKAATIKRVASYSLWGSVVVGAAVATGLANLVVVTYFVVWLTRNSEHVSLSPRWFTLAGSVQKPVLGVSVGTLLQSAFLIVTALVLNNLAAAYGEGPLAAMGVAVRIAQVPEFLIMGVTIGVLPLLAYSYGKGDGARFGSALRASAITVGAVAALAATLVLCFRDQVFTLFVADESVLAVGVVVLAAQLARDDRERLHGPHHLAVPGDRPCPPRDDHVGRSGGAVHSRRNRREHLARPGRHHLGAHRHRGRSAGRRSGPLRRVGSRTQAGPC